MMSLLGGKAACRSQTALRMGGSAVRAEVGRDQAPGTAAVMSAPLQRVSRTSSACKGESEGEGDARRQQTG